MSNQPTIQCLRFDHWAHVPVFELEPGDMIRQENLVAVVKQQPYRSDSGIQVPAERYEEGTIKVMLGESEREAIIQAMDCVGSTLVEFGDGTAMIAELEYGHGYVFSPRLALEELEAFCQEHLPQYEAFFDKHQHAIDNGQLVAMRPFWQTTAGINKEVAANDE